MKHWWVPGLQIGYEQFIHQVADFLEGLRTGQAAAPTFRDALATFRRKIGWRWLLDRIDWFAENCKIGRIWVDVGRDH
jgi:hypothetical protein